MRAHQSQGRILKEREAATAAKKARRPEDQRTERGTASMVPYYRLMNISCPVCHAKPDAESLLVAVLFDTLGEQLQRRGFPDIAELAVGTDAEGDGVGLLLDCVGGLLEEVAALAELVRSLGRRARGRATGRISGAVNQSCRRGKACTSSGHESNGGTSARPRLR